MNTKYHKKDMMDIFSHALKTVDPYELAGMYSEKIRTAYHDSGASRLIVTGFGKASCHMLLALEDQIADMVDAGIVITKYGHTVVGRDAARGSASRVRIFEAGHPVPDENGLMATQQVMNLLATADEKTLVVCLISGGGSALLISPYEQISLKDKQEVTGLLLRAGADINELNTVRKHISAVKGGRLAEAAYPARIISLIISDVIGDRLDVIASGPTSPDGTTYQDALNVIDKYALKNRTPFSVMDLLQKGAAGLVPETPKAGSLVFDGIDNIIIGNNTKALEAAKERAESLGLEAEIISSEIKGEAREVGRWLAHRAAELRNKPQRRQSFCMISGGETTVTVTGSGLGGRNMELALAFAIEIEGIDGITFVSAGTDGTDGPTDATGAIVDGQTIRKAREKGLDPSVYLNNNDSYNFFSQIESLIKTGPTGTNVMDMQVIIVD